MIYSLIHLRSWEIRANISCSLSEIEVELAVTHHARHETTPPRGAHINDPVSHRAFTLVTGVPFDLVVVYAVPAPPPSPITQFIGFAFR